MNWTVVAAQLCLVTALATAPLACGKGDKGHGVFAVDQRAHVESLAAVLPDAVLDIWRQDSQSRAPQLRSDGKPSECAPVLCQVADAWFEENHDQRVLIDSSYQLTPAATQWLAILDNLQVHGLPRAAFQVDAIDALRDALQEVRSDQDWVNALPLSSELLDEAGAHFRELSRREPAASDDVAAWIAASERPEIVAIRQDFERDEQERAAAANQLEWLLTLAWLEYADQMHARNVNYWDEATLLETGLVVVDPDAVVSEDEPEGGTVTMPKTIAARRAGVPEETIQQATDLLRTRALQEIVKTLGTDTLTQKASGLEPPFAHYAALKQALADYLQLAANGGWATDLAIERELKVGQRHAEIPRLRERLRAEGFAVTDSASMVLDAELSEALKAYQYTHQLEQHGRITPPLITSLNRSVETRVAEIAVAMQAWRMNPMGRDYAGYRIEINVPDFHAEVWDGAELLSRFRVVVGRFSRPGAVVQTKTPMFSDQLSRIVLNPYWNVPQSIVIHEILPAAAEDPEYYEKRNYEVRERGARTFIRQRPGPGNALGRVKFLFPNEYAVYMHDTPSKTLFSRSVRAFSHGCIRVQDPMNFAELLISRDRNWSIPATKRFIERALKRTEEESYVNFDHPVPVHLYYAGVNVVDGKPHFLADIYRELGEDIVANMAYVEEWLGRKPLPSDAATHADGH